MTRPRSGRIPFGRIGIVIRQRDIGRALIDRRARCDIDDIVDTQECFIDPCARFVPPLG